METPRRLSELQGEDPMILTLARGHYCPKEHQQHLELAAFYPKIAVACTQVATIATDDHHTLQEFRASVGAQWPFLSDPGRQVAPIHQSPQTTSRAFIDSEKRVEVMLHWSRLISVVQDSRSLRSSSATQITIGISETF
jgi:peroxiredoxin